MKKVVRFGGGSLASARRFRRMVDTMEANRSGRYVVPPVPSKRSDKDEKVTDMLYARCDAVVGGRSYKKILEKVKSRYLDVIDGFNLNPNLDHEFEGIEENLLTKTGGDYTVFREEYLDGIVTTDYLGYRFIDVTEVILFDDNGSFETGLTNRGLSERLGHVERAVILGFYGSKHDGTVGTFSEGGSSVTGPIVVKTICTDIYENRIDVSGILATDPGIVNDPEVTETITYRRLREPPYMGANVLHEDAIFPVHKEGILINIRNTNRPEDKGTLIVGSTCRRPRHTITEVADKKGLCSINIEETMMNAETGFGRKMLSVFEQYGIPFEHMPSGIDTMTVYMRQSKFEEYKQSVIAGIHRAVEPDTVRLESDLALIVVVGRGMRSDRGTTGRVFSILARVRMNIKMIDQGSSEQNIIIGVKDDDFKTAVHAAYDIFVTMEL